jgi:DNA-binding transcriptional regulator GbsR (MarR family)
MAELSKIQRRYVLHWGEMGTRWGINRTVAQIHALLYLWPTPLAADEIAQTLSVARSNVSTSVRELESWGLVRPVHVLGDRREHYESLKDVCEMFRVIIEQRKRREIDPTLQLLRSCLEELEDGKGEAYTRDRLREMAEFFESATAAYAEMARFSPSALKGLIKMPGKMRKLLHRVSG